MKKRIAVPYREADRIAPYLEALKAVDLEPEPLLPEQPIVMSGYDGLLLTGGTDVDPALYGEARHSETDTPDVERDRAEWEALSRALELDMPVLAICRGHQLLNVFHGGTLIQHLGSERHVQRPKNKALPAHNVVIEPGTRIADVAGPDELPVNSRHHQAVGEVGKELRVIGRDPVDGVIEAIERPGRSFVVGVQWHPEDQVFLFPEQKMLFKAFAAKVAGEHASR